jgi:hypothetical protein
VIRDLSIAIIAAIFLMQATPALVRAEEPPVDRDLYTRDLKRAGPFLIRPLFILRDVGYDDNVRFDTVNPEGSTTATLGMGLHSLLLTGDRGGLRMYQEIDYTAFGSEHEQNHWDLLSRARGIFLFKKALLSLENDFSYTRQRPNTEIDQRVRLRENIVETVARSLTEGFLGGRGFLKYRKLDYGSDEFDFAIGQERLNRTEKSVGAAAEFRMLPKTTFFVEGILTDIDFDDNSEGRDSDVDTILVGVEFDPSASIQGKLMIGESELVAPARPESNTRQPVGEAELSMRLGSRSRGRGTFERNLVFSIFQENLYYIGTYWTAAYEYFFSRRISGELMYGEGTNEYPLEVTRGGIDPFQGLRTDEITRYQVAVRYRFNRLESFEVKWFRLERDSSDDFWDRSRNYYTFGYTHAF